MNSIDKVKAAFSHAGFTGGSVMRQSELERFLSSLVREKGEMFEPEVITQIWEQSSNGKTQVSVDEVCHTIVEAQNIVQNRLLQITDQIKFIKDQLRNEDQSASNAKVIRLQGEIDRLLGEKIEYQEDLRLLTEPFGISIAAFMARAAASRRKSKISNPDEPAEKNLDEQGNQLQLKWMFILILALGVIEVVVIFQKYDFLNVIAFFTQLIVLTSLLFIFLMNHFDRTYIKFNLALLITSELLDSAWLFMNSSDYWSPPGNGTTSGYQRGYLKLIIVLTYIGVFLKIPLGVFLYHYRNVEESKTYDLDMGLVKFTLTPNKMNPITDRLNTFIISN